MREPKYAIVCDKKRKVYFADDEGIFAIYKAKKKEWPEILKGFQKSSPKNEI